MPNDETQKLAETHAAEAKNAEIVAMDAREKSDHARMKAAFSEAVTEMLDSGKGRYVDVTRVPLICQAIVGLNKGMEALNQKMDDLDQRYVNKDQFWPVRMIVYGGAGFILIAFLGSLIILTIPHAAVSPL